MERGGRGGWVRADVRRGCVEELYRVAISHLSWWQARFVLKEAYLTNREVVLKEVSFSKASAVLNKLPWTQGCLESCPEAQPASFSSSSSQQNTAPTLYLSLRKLSLLQTLSPSLSISQTSANSCRVWFQLYTTVTLTTAAAKSSSRPFYISLLNCRFSYCCTLYLLAFSISLTVIDIHKTVRLQASSPSL